MHVHRGCGVGSQCVEGCSYMSAVTWKPACTFSWDGLCCVACGDAQMAAVALVDSSVLYFFVSETLVAKFELLVLPGDGMEVTMADGGQVKASKTFLVPLAVCSAYYQALHCVVECQLLAKVNHDIVLGVEWLQATNLVISW